MKQNKCKIIGLTGGIASGKSTVSSILMDKGYRVIDADLIARQVVEVGKPAYNELVSFFGESILNRDLTINRKALGDKVFSNKELLVKLNEITHFYIYKKMKEQIREYSSEGKPIFLDIPLLFEELKKISMNNIFFDEIWLVYVDFSTQLRRLMDRDGLGREEAEKRISLQISLEEKRRMASRVVDNSGSIDETSSQIQVILDKL